MEQIVGVKPHDIKTICKTIQNVPGVESLVERWVNLARELELDNAIPELKRIILADSNYLEVMHQLLNKFKEKHGNNAKLSMLISALESCGYQNVADELTVAFPARREPEYGYPQGGDHRGRNNDRRQDSEEEGCCGGNIHHP